MPLANDGVLKIDFAGYARTAQGCGSPEILAQAELVVTVLEDATAYTIDGDRLTITDTAGNEIVFGPQPEVLLIGKTWNVPMLYTILPDGEVRGDALVEGTEITLTFNADGTLAGNASCNTYGGTYTIDGASITIDSLYWTEMACPDPPGIMEQEMTYLETLRAVTTWQIGMNGLTLTTDDGRALRELNVVSPSR
jgi:heat shock protein HslJ